MNESGSLPSSLDETQRRLLAEAVRLGKMELSEVPIFIDDLAGREAPLSLAQERLWILEQLGLGGAVYLEPYSCELPGSLNVAALRQALRWLVDRQSVLRTVIEARQGQPVQRLSSSPRPLLPRLDLTALSEAESVASRLTSLAAARPFRLAQAPGWRALLLSHVGGHRFVLCLHHILCDAASIQLIARELGSLYSAALSGAPSPSEPKVRFADFARWQREFQLPLLLERQLPWWRSQLEGVRTLLELPTDRTRGASPSGRGKRLVSILPGAVLEATQRVARQHHASPFMVFLAAYGVLLARWTGRRELLVGVPVEGRLRPEVRELVGFFVNTVPIRLELSAGQTSSQLLSRVRDRTLDALAHQDLPFSSLVEALAPERAASQPPLVQTMMVMQSAARPAASSAEISFPLRRLDNGTSKFDLSLVIRELPGSAGSELECGLEYSSDHFDHATIERLAEAYGTVLENLESHLEKSLLDLPWISTSAAQELTALRGPRQVFDTASTVPERFAAAAAGGPDRVAVVDERECLSYHYLDSRSRQLAARLIASGVGPESIVALAIDPDHDFVVAMLAVLRAGAAYLPIDPSYPAERFRFLVEDSRARMLLTVAARAEKLPHPLSDTAPSLLLVDQEPTARREWEPAPPPLEPDNLAYLIYTSGSTGRPKGVMVAHRTLLNLCDNFISMFAQGPGRRQLMLLSTSFDASVGDLFPPLLAGGTLVTCPQASELGVGGLTRLVDRYQVEVLELAASFWKMWLRSLVAQQNEPGGTRLGSLDTVIVGGESISGEEVRQWFTLSPPLARPRRLLHNYGPTEATVCSSSRPVLQAEQMPAGRPRLSIGKPLANIHLLIIDLCHGQSLPPFLPGELAIGGDGVTRGYHRRAAATALAFMPDPTAGSFGQRLYRTGDRVRFLACGELDFLGRIDEQIKIRGQRLEPGEIESLLAEHPRLAAATVLARSTPGGEPRLVAYIVPHQAPAPHVSVLRSYLLDRLPAPLVPELFVTLPSLPLTVHGKVDRRALPEPDLPQRGADAVRRPPTTELERRISAAWRRVLDLEHVGVDDNFFDLGGSSLRLLQLQGELEAELGREIAVADLFRFPRVSSLADHLEVLSTTGPQTTEKAPEPGAVGRGAASRAANRGADLAIIAVSGRFPGADSPEEMWRLSCLGVESLRTFSDEELLAEGFPAALLAEPRFVKVKGMVERSTWFDAEFFAVPAREAELIDPQQRLVLECAWEAFERAGYEPQAITGDVAVLVGLGRDSYLINNLLSRKEIVEAAGMMQLNMANGREFAAQRIAYKFDLKGPAMAVQTACSTSLVAVHLAARLLRAGDCDLALAGGATVSFPERAGYLYLDGGIFSGDGHCRAFDSQAQGVVPGNGVALVLLKRLEEAVSDGDPILAILRGSAINQDGSVKVGWSAPSVEGQVRAMQRSLADANASPDSVNYIETHGTGTVLGDLAEAEALKKIYGGLDAEADTNGLSPCAITSLKTNLGHLDTAAGAASLIRAVFALRDARIPPSLHLETTNPKLRFEGSRLFVNAELNSWPQRSGARRAAVNSLGLGGTNAHVIVEEPPAEPPPAPGRAAELLPLSARSAAALDQMASRLADFLDQHPHLSLADVAHTLEVGRRRFTFRRIVVASSLSEASASLRRSLGTEPTKPEPNAEVVFLFPPSGTHYPGMAQQLYAEEAVFRQELDRVAGLLKPHLRHPLSGAPFELLPLLFNQPGQEDQARQLAECNSFAQPATFAVEWALARLWWSWGLRPRALLGHSLGEYTAACLAGVFRLEEAAELVALRARWMDQLPAGATTSVSAAESVLRPLLDDSLDIAALNLPGLTSVSGPTPALAAFEERLAAAGIQYRRVRVATAGHSRHLEPMLSPLRELLTRMTLSPPELPLVSNLTGSWLAAEEAIRPEYWLHQVRQTVRFSQGLDTLLDGEPKVLVEVGPGKSLSRIAWEHPKFSARHRTVVSLRSAKDPAPDLSTLLEALGQLWAAGVDINWAAFRGAERRRRVTLPTYPFERRPYFIPPPHVEASQPSEPAAAQAAAPSRPRQRAARPELSLAYVPPRDTTESELVLAWEELLGVAPVGVQDGFFELGGDSLLAMNLAARCDRLLGHGGSLGILLEEGTVEALAAAHRRLGKLSPAEAADPSPTRAEQGPWAPLSFVQQEVWNNRFEPGGVLPHNAAEALLADGELDLARFHRALSLTAARHPMLRTVFAARPDGVHQRALPPFPVQVPLVDLRGLKDDTRQQSVEQLALWSYREQFDPFAGPTYRFVVLRLEPGRHAVLRSVDRLIFDGASLAVLLRELDTNYRAETPRLISGELERAALAGEPAAYLEYARQQQESVSTPSFLAERRFWHSHLSQAPTSLDLPTDLDRGLEMSTLGARLALSLSAATQTQIRALAGQARTTLFVALLALYGLVLSRFSRQTTLLIASPITLRGSDNAEVIGRFLNTLALRVDVGQTDTFRDLVTTVRRSVQRSFTHHTYPFHILANELCPRPQPGRGPLCQAAFLLHDHAHPWLRLGDLSYRAVPVDRETSEHDLTLSLAPDNKGGLAGFLEYRKDLFHPITIRRLAAALVQLSERLTAAPETSLASLGAWGEGMGVPSSATSPSSPDASATPL